MSGKFLVNDVETDFGRYRIDDPGSSSDYIEFTIWGSGDSIAMKVDEWEKLMEELPEAIKVLNEGRKQ